MGLIECAVRRIGAQQVFDFRERPGEIGRVDFPGCTLLGVHRHHRQRFGANRRLGRKYPHFRPLDYRPVVAVRAKPNGVRLRIAQRQRAHLGRHIQPRCAPRTAIVQTHLLGLQGNVGAALYVGGVSLGIVHRHAVDGNAHVVQRQRVLGRQFTEYRLHVNARIRVVFGHHIVNRLHFYERLSALHESLLHDIVSMQITAPFVLRLRFFQRQLRGHLSHRALCASRRQTNVVAIHVRGAALQSFVCGVADKSQPRIIPQREFPECALNRSKIGWR